MAMEPTNNSDSGVTMLALIVGALVVLVAFLFAGGAFDARSPEKNTISIDVPASNPAPANPAPATND